ncbi:MAG: PfkB family carbohydrate kinase, partial [Desulfurococcales archaeon]|nr:PfkB family carbohydrate kinase [Desulfurococcales archaeon]
RVAEIAKEAGGVVSWDPGRRLASLGLERVKPLLGKTDIVLLNKNEARLLTGREPREAAEIIAEQGPRYVIVKLGAEGALLYNKLKREITHIPPYKPEKIVDTTGAGDAYAAATLLKIARGEPVEEAARYGAVVAARKIARLGAHAL